MMIQDRDALKPADVVKDAVTIALVVLFLFSFRLCIVSGNSMSPTLHDGDVVFSSATFGTGLRRGDIIVFRALDSGTLVKRVVGIPGDDIVVAGGAVYINNERLVEGYTAPGLYADGDMSYPLRIPSGCYFVMGDNRPYSRDSRMRCVGLVHNEDVLGVVRLVL